MGPRLDVSIHSRLGLVMHSDSLSPLQYYQNSIEMIKQQRICGGVFSNVITIVCALIHSMLLL